AQRFTMSNDFFRDFVRVADQQCALRASLSIEISARHGTPAAFLPYISKRTGVAGKEIISGLLRRRCNVAERVHADFEPVGRVSHASARFPIEIDERAEAVRMPTDDGNHQGKAEHACPD